VGFVRMGVEDTIQVSERAVSIPALEELSLAIQAPKRAKAELRRKRRQIGRVRRRQRTRRRLAIAGVVTAALTIAAVCYAGASALNHPATAPLNPGKPSDFNRVTTSGRTFLLTGGPKEAGLQGFRDCNAGEGQDSTIYCYRRPASVFGLEALEAFVMLRNPGQGFEAVDPATTSYWGIFFTMKDRANAAARVAAKLERAGWLRTSGLDHAIYYHEGKSISIEVWPDYTHDHLVLAIEPIDGMLANSRAAMLRAKRDNTEIGNQRVSRFINQMRQLGAKPL